MSGKYPRIWLVLWWVALEKNKPSCTCHQIKSMFLLCSVVSALEVCCVSLPAAFPGGARLQLLFEESPLNYQQNTSKCLCSYEIPKGIKTSLYQILAGICCMLFPAINKWKQIPSGFFCPINVFPDVSLPQFCLHRMWSLWEQWAAHRVTILLNWQFLHF